MIKIRLTKIPFIMKGQKGYKPNRIDGRAFLVDRLADENTLVV